ncbi:complex I subunit 5 family protein [Thioalkalivibrio sp. XN8]|uniref:complex I subunit 5 family protein n=1 Tax=Thioalkalivibrio sp. XN8 TaxID=2712863 RepID=UPI0013E9FCC7|nr:complex I subunit 5 family protein [Thioalkalivibrio sp. XN8]NGP52686.1 NADH dehydrogenase [Thioalkalivibrio sp. XN8]
MGIDIVLRELPLLLVFGPMAAAAVVPWLQRRGPGLRDAWVLGVTAATLAGVVALLLQDGDVPAAGVPVLLGRLSFAADAFGLLFALFSAFVWFCATLFALSYLRGDGRAGRFHAASLVTLGAQLGVALAADLVTLYVCFETLGLVALLLVVHRGTAEARRAATQYFWLTVLGGILLLAGIMLVAALGGGELQPGRLAGGGATAATAAALMVLGFGVKAGMVPLHLWLPNAHPVAPPPASALLSGVMIKAGACGIFRTLYLVFWPAPQAGGIGPAFTAQLGLVVLWLGILTMAVGVVMALGQRDAKRMLAYHSISQMGFILAGLGAGAFLGAEGASGAAGGLMHALNHALFKSCLFLGIGAVAWRAGTGDMYALGGLWRRMPVTFVLMLVAAAGISGVPLFNGFISKCLVHHALTAAEVASGLRSLRVAEFVYVLVCAGTAASFIKLVGLVFLGRARGEASARAREAPAPMLLAMALLCLPIVWLGLDPAPVLGGLLAPGLAGAGLAVAGLHEHVHHGFLVAGDTMLALAMVALGAVICLLGLRLGWFHWQPPRWLGLGWWLQRAGLGVLAGAPGEPGLASGLVRFARLYARFAQRLAWLGRRAGRRCMGALRGFDLARRGLAQGWLAGPPGSPGQAFLEAAWLDLEQERQRTLRAAWQAIAADCDTRGAALAPHEREAQLAAGRAVAGAMATALFEHRLAALTAAARTEAPGRLRARYQELHRMLAASRQAVAAAAPDLAATRRRGDNLFRPLHAALDPLLRREAAVLGDEAAHPAPAVAAPAGGIRGWLLAVLRLGVAELRQHQAAWPRAEGLDTDPAVLLGRWQLQRYARDMGLNVGLAVVLMAALVIALWLAGAA